MTNTNSNMSSVITGENNKRLSESYHKIKTWLFGNSHNDDGDNNSNNDNTSDNEPIETINKVLKDLSPTDTTYQLTKNIPKKKESWSTYLSVNLNDPELHTMSTIIVGRQLGHALGSYPLTLLQYQPVDVVYNVFINTFNHLIFWSIDKMAIGYLCQIPVFSPYQDHLLTIINSGRYGFLTYKTISDTVNKEDYPKKSLTDKCQELAVDFGFLGAKMLESYLVYKLEKYLCNTGNVFLSLSLIVGFHFSCTKLEKMLKENQDVKMNLENTMINKKLIDYKSGVYEPKVEL